MSDKKPRAQTDAPKTKGARRVTVNVRYAKPSFEAEECWLRALRILLDSGEDPDKTRGGSA